MWLKSIASDERKDGDGSNLASGSFQYPLLTHLLRISGAVSTSKNNNIAYYFYFITNNFPNKYTIFHFQIFFVSLRAKSISCRFVVMTLQNVLNIHYFIFLVLHVDMRGKKGSFRERGAEGANGDDDDDDDLDLDRKEAERDQKRKRMVVRHGIDGSVSLILFCVDSIEVVS